MDFQKESDCTDTLLDLVCYEVLGKRLSPEMNEILERHLSECPACRRKVLGFNLILREEMVQPNFG